MVKLILLLFFLNNSLPSSLNPILSFPSNIPQNSHSKPPGTHPIQVLHLSTAPLPDPFIPLVPTDLPVSSVATATLPPMLEVTLDDCRDGPRYSDLIGDVQALNVWRSSEVMMWRGWSWLVVMVERWLGFCFFFPSFFCCCSFWEDNWNRLIVC